MISGIFQVFQVFSMIVVDVLKFLFFPIFRKNDGNSVIFDENRHFWGKQK